MADQNYTKTDHYRAFRRIVARLSPFHRALLQKAIREVDLALALGHGFAAVCWIIARRSVAGKTFTPQELMDLTNGVGRFSIEGAKESDL